MAESGGSKSAAGGTKSGGTKSGGDTSPSGVNASQIELEQLESTERVEGEGEEKQGQEEVNRPSTYTIRPKFEKKFRPAVVKELIHVVLRECLSEKNYNCDEAKSWTREISDVIQSKLKELQLERYKYVIQVVIGEQRGEGVRMGCRCFWDSDTDNYAQDIFMNDTLFCVAAAYGIYYY